MIFLLLFKGMVMFDVVFILELFLEKICFYVEVIGLFCWIMSFVMMVLIGYLMRDYLWRYF